VGPWALWSRFPYCTHLPASLGPLPPFSHVLPHNHDVGVNYILSVCSGRLGPVPRCKSRSKREQTPQRIEQQWASRCVVEVLSDDRRWQGIRTGWVRGVQVVVSAVRPPGSPLRPCAAVVRGRAQQHQHQHRGSSIRTLEQSPMSSNLTAADAPCGRQAARAGAVAAARTRAPGLPLLMRAAAVDCGSFRPPFSQPFPSSTASPTGRPRRRRIRRCPPVRTHPPAPVQPPVGGFRSSRGGDPPRRGRLLGRHARDVRPLQAGQDGRQRHGWVWLNFTCRTLERLFWQLSPAGADVRCSAAACVQTNSRRTPLPILPSQPHPPSPSSQARAPGPQGPQEVGGLERQKG
jgi:hypothetical protein